MFVIKRKENLIETVKFENNGKDLIIDVKVNLLNTLNKYEKASRAIQLAIVDIQKGILTDAKKIGDVIIEMLTIVFGNDTQKIIDFYDGDYTELLLDVWPFIISVVTPAYQKVKKQRQKEIKQRIKKI